MDSPSVMSERDDCKGLDSTLVGRFYFSRSICHRLDRTLSASPASFSTSKPLMNLDNGERSNSIAGAPVSEEADSNNSPHASPRQRRRPSSLPLLFSQSDKAYPSASPVTSPSMKTTPSRVSHNSSDNKVNFSTEEDAHILHDRAMSWSEHIDHFRGQKPVEAAEGWTVAMTELFLGNKFASGAHSRLYHGIYKGKDVAVKLLRQPDEDEELAKRLEEQFIQEVTLLSRLHHPNVVEFVAACRKPPVCCIIMEYLPNSSLRAFLNKKESHSLPLSLVLTMSLDVARGMAYVHSQGIIHRDLKSENLCLQKDLHVKVTDFGTACFATECNVFAKDAGTYRWMAPEMISHKPYSGKVDVYSFGIILWEMCTGLIPFEKMSAVQAAFAVVDKHARPEIPLDCPHALRELMKHCWSANPDKRPEFSEIVTVLEQFQDMSMEDLNLSRWQYPSHHTNLLLKCFTGSS